MKTQHQQLQQLREAWSAEMATFRELRQTNQALTEELRECLQKLDALTPPVRLRGKTYNLNL